MANPTALYKQCDTFTAERFDNVLLLRFVDRPFVFTLDMGAKNRFVECLESVAHDDRIKAVVLFGRGEDVFCHRLINLLLAKSLALCVAHRWCAVLPWCRRNVRGHSARRCCWRCFISIPAFLL